jgi:hypothetical protein
MQLHEVDPQLSSHDACHIVLAVQASPDGFVLQLYPEMPVGEIDDQLARHPGVVLVPHLFGTQQFQQVQYRPSTSASSCRITADASLGAHVARMNSRDSSASRETRGVITREMQS